MMKIKTSKKPKLYLKNNYASHLTRPQKQNNKKKEYIDNPKITTNFNINQVINFNPNALFINKKTLYQNCYPNKTFLIKGCPNFLSHKNILNRSNKNNRDKQISLGIITDSNVSGRKRNPKNYEILNPFKERSNSENKINCFNRTYTFFNNVNNDNNQKAYLNTKPNINNINKKQMKKSMNKLSINLNDISYQNNPTKLYRLSKENSKNNISPIKNKNEKAYFYQDKKYAKNDLEERQSFSKLQKKSSNPMSPLIEKNIDYRNMTTPNSNGYNAFNINRKNTGRIQKYILSDKRKIKSRQCFRQYLPISKTSESNNENIIKNSKYLKSPNTSDNKYIESSINSPSLPSLTSNTDELNNNDKIKNKKKYIWMKKINNINNNYLLYELKNNYKNHNKINKNVTNIRNNLSSNSTLENLFPNIDKNKIKGIEEKDLFEQSAITIQSAFRGYRFKSRFERNLCNYKDYIKGFDILEKLNI